MASQTPLTGTEDDILWEEEAAVPDEESEEEDEDHDVYDDRLTEEQWQNLFGESDDEEEFDGF